ncbi:MAG: peptidase U32 family protein [Bacillota bacterium]
MKLAVPIKHKHDIERFIHLNIDTLIIGITPYAHRMEGTFKIDELKPLIETIKTHHKNVWINLNALCHEDDLKGLNTILKNIESLPIDGILFADLAVYQYAKTYALTNKLIYYPETYTTSSKDVQFWHNEGIKSLVIGREMTLNDIKAMTEAQTMPLTLVGHGYLNMFHSKRPLVENYFKYTKDQDIDRVKNNRNLTLIEERRNETYPILQDDYGTHIFRSKPIASFSVLETLKSRIDTMIIDTVLLREDMITQIIKDYQALLAGKQVDLSRYENTTDTGFYFKETGTKKGEAS